ncbi:MAG TPA: maleylpyruvate isomerase family mycothiol-dependent enzyme [Mycobacteriales bacterium]
MTADTGARLLLTERDALLPILRRTPAEAFDRPTVCTDWTVRDVLAHCGCALTRAAEGRLHRFTPELNEVDVAERRAWPLEQVLAELERGYGGAAAAVTAAQGRLDGLALGEWIHGGDVREALGEPGAYESVGIEDALLLLVDRSRTVPPTLVRLPDREIQLGDGTPSAELDTDAPTLIRLSSGRHPDPARFRLTGATPDQYVVFS